MIRLLLQLLNTYVDFWRCRGNWLFFVINEYFVVPATCMLWKWFISILNSVVDVDGVKFNNKKNIYTCIILSNPHGVSWNLVTSLLMTKIQYWEQYVENNNVSVFYWNYFWLRDNDWSKCLKIYFSDRLRLRHLIFKDSLRVNMFDMISLLTFMDCYEIWTETKI